MAAADGRAPHHRCIIVQRTERDIHALRAKPTLQPFVRPLFSAGDRWLAPHPRRAVAIDRYTLRRRADHGCLDAGAFLVSAVRGPTALAWHRTRCADGHPTVG